MNILAETRYTRGASWRKIAEAGISVYGKPSEGASWIVPHVISLRGFISPDSAVNPDGGVRVCGSVLGRRLILRACIAFTKRRSVHCQLSF